jgi:hypothetical protein
MSLAKYVHKCCDTQCLYMENMFNCYIKDFIYLWTAHLQQYVGNNSYVHVKQ